MKNNSIKKIIACGLMSLSLIAIAPVTNAFAASEVIKIQPIVDMQNCPEVTSEERQANEEFLKTCNKVELGGHHLYEKDGKYYGKSGNGLTPNWFAGTGDLFILPDKSLARNQWVNFTWYSRYGKPSTGNDWRYYGDDCKNVTGNQVIDGKKYVFNSSGNLVIGWGLANKNGWYYTNPDGTIYEKGWLWYNNHWYYIYPETGQMAKSTTIDGYKLGRTGILLKNQN